MFNKVPNLEYLRSFHMVVAYGSIAETVTKSNATRPTLSRHIQLLEDELEVNLFRRTKNGLVLTDQGQTAYAYSENIFKMAADMADDVIGPTKLLSGPVKIVSSSGVAAIILPKIFKKLCNLSSDIELNIKPVGEVTGQLLSENDIAIQTHRPTQKNNIARKIGNIHLGIYASLDYLKQNGEPQSFSELGHHYLVGNRQSKAEREQLSENWKAWEAQIYSQTIHHRCHDHAVSWRMVVEGCGIGLTHISFGDSEPRVKRILTNLPSLTLPLWLVTHEEIKKTPRIRFIYDLIANHTQSLS